VALADGLFGRRINPLGADLAGRAYALSEVEDPHPIQTALVFWRDDDSKVIRFFHTDREAVMWATVDALRRSLAKDCAR
jgi:hypothetical protein